MSLLIAGDLVPYGNDLNLFKSGNINGLMGEKLLELWNNSKYRIINLETPLTNVGDPILKCGPNFRTDEECINGVSALKPSLLCLANNHILDYGEIGLTRTIKLIENKHINYVGVGTNNQSIKKYSFLNIDGVVVAIYNICEIEFSVTDKNFAGANGYDEGDIIKDLLAIQKKCDYIIVIYHGGKEYYRYPSPLLQKRCRLLVDFGADLIVCQHSHCIGSEEIYKNKHIVYGQGNFMFNNVNNKFWNESLLVKVEFKNGMKVDYIPIIKRKIGIDIPLQEDYDSIMNEFKSRNNAIKSEKFVEMEYSKFANTNFYNYLYEIHGSNIFLRILFKLTKGKIMDYLYNKEKLLIIHNFVECEAHRELLIKGIKNKEKR